MAWRATVRTLVLTALGLAALAISIYLKPWSNDWIDRRLQRQWLQATGLELQYEKATFRFDDGLFQVDKPVLVDPDNGRPLLEAGGLSLRMSLIRFALGRPPYTIESIELEGPLNLELTLRDGRLQPDASWDRILRIVRERPRPSQRPAAASASALPARFGIRHVLLGPLGLTVWDEQNGARHKLLELNQATLQADFEGRLYPHSASLRGSLNGRPNNNSFWMTLRPSMEDGRIALTMVLPEVDSRRDLPWPAAADWRAGGVEVQGALLSLGDGEWSLDGEATIEESSAARPSPETPLELGAARLGWTLRANLIDRRLALTDLRLDSDACRLQATGTMRARYPFEYALQVRPIELSERGLQVLALQWPLLSGVGLREDASLQVSGRAEGDLGRLLPRVLTGGVRLNGVDWQSRVWPAPLQELQLEARLTTGSLEVDGLRGAVGGIPVEFQGRVEGALLEGRVGRVDLQWTTLGSVAGLMNLIDHAPRAAVALPRLSGDFTGEGRLSVIEPLNGEWRQVLERSKLEGRLMFQRGRMEHPLLPAPLQDLNGELLYGFDGIRCRHLAGRMFEGDFVIEGEVTGKPAFWIDPVARLRVEADGELQRMLPALAARFPDARAPLDQATTPTGRLEAALEMRTDFRTLEGTQYRGSIALRDAATTLTRAHAEGPLRLTLATIAITTESLRLESAEGTLGGLRLSADATVGANDGALNARLSGALREFQSRLPGLLDDFRVDGQAAVEHRIDFQRVASSPPVRRWAELAPVFRRAMDRLIDPLTELRQTAEIRYAGRIQLRDAEMTYKSMPTRLAGITGLLRYDRDHIWSPEPLALEGGEGGRAMSSSFEFVFPAEGVTPVLRFNGRGEHFPLDRWATTWHEYGEQTREGAGVAPGSGDERQAGAATPDYASRWPIDYEVDRSEPILLAIEGRVRSTSVSFHRLQGEEFDGSLHLECYRVQPNIVRWDGVRARVNGGRLRASGQAFNWQMTNDVELEDVDLAGLALALSGGQRVHGIFSGRISGNLALHTGFGHFDSPPTGGGELRIAGSRFVSNSVLGDLGGVTRLPLFDDVSFSNIHGPFTVVYPTYATKGIIFENPLMNLNLSGKVGPEGALDLDLRLQFLRIAEGVPLVGEVLDLFNRVAGTLLRFSVGGTVEEPRITPL
jgi:hypothetical protein